MANGKIRFGKQSGGQLALVFPDGVDNTEVVVPERGELATKQYVDDYTNALTDELLALLTTKKVKNVTTDALNDKLVITYTDDTVANLNINDIITDVHVSGATLNATTNVLTLTSTDGGADVTVDLSDFVNSSELTSALSGKANDNTVVKLTGNQTVAGAKTFSSTIIGNLSGNAATATKLATARTINGVSFDGSANITVSDDTAVKLTGNSVNVNTGNYHQLKQLPAIPGGDPGFAAGYKYFLLCPWNGVENKIVGKLYAGRHTSVSAHGKMWVIDIASRYNTINRSINYSIQSSTHEDTFNLVKVTYNSIEYLGIKLTDSNYPVFRAGIVFSGFESGCIFEWVNESDIANEEVAPTSGYHKFSNDIKAPNLRSGLYMPVITSVSNVASFTANSLYYSVVDNVVTVFGGFPMKATTAEEITEFNISLPIGSLRWWRAAAGSFTTRDSSDVPIAGIITGTNNDLSIVRCVYKPTSNASLPVNITFSYNLPE